MPEFSRHEPGSFCWAELATTDDGAAKKFYSTLFDWSFEDSPAGPDMVYSMLKKRGRSLGALYKMGPQEQGVPPHWNTYVSVASADDSARKAKGLGGKLLMEPFDVMDVGRMAVVQDPQDAVFSIWEPRKHIGAELMNEPNTMCWCELQTTDTEGAKRFYTGLFGWGTKVGGDYTEWLRGGTSIGGMMKIQKEWGPVPSNWMIYFAVEDCDGTVEKAKRAGGSAVMGPMDIEMAGRFAILTDPQGAAFAVIKLTVPA